MIGFTISLGPPSLKSATATLIWRAKRGEMAPKPDLALAFGLVLAVALVVLAITTWADHLPNPGNSVAPIPPRMMPFLASRYAPGVSTPKK